MANENLARFFFSVIVFEVVMQLSLVTLVTGNPLVQQTRFSPDSEHLQVVVAAPSRDTEEENSRPNEPAQVMWSDDDGEAEEERRTMTDGNSTCGGCSPRSELSPEQLRQARIEVIKQQILQKLRLKDAPRVRVSRTALPGLLTAGNLLVPSEHVESAGDRQVDEFYGTTQNVIILPENKFDHMCRSPASFPTSCFIFKLTPELINTGINSAELWIFKMADSSDSYNHTVDVTSFIWDENTDTLHKNVIAVRNGVSNEGWLRFDIGKAVQQWAQAEPTSEYGLEISCPTCQNSVETSPVSYQDDNKPFLVIRADSSSSKVRTKRSVDCSDSSSHCCRESFYVSFKEIGWDNWILQPAGYNANYCRGPCLHDVSISRYHHTTVVQRFLQSQSSSSGETVSLTLCCTPSRMSSISLIYLDEDGYIFQKNLPNMVVESCDCA